jgi:putative Mn2+ efflux pump MntP
MQRPKWLKDWIFKALDAMLTALLGVYILFDWLSDWKPTWYGVLFVILGLFLVYEGLNKIYKLVETREKH